MHKSPINQVGLSHKQLQLHTQQQQQKYYMENHHYPNNSPIPHFPPPPEYPPPVHHGAYEIQNCQRQNSIEGEQQPINWNRSNIAATMEKYEPAQKHQNSFNTTGHSSKYNQNHSYQQKNSPFTNQDRLNEIHQDYAYAYYEPGAAMRHQNIPGCYEEAGPSRPPPANSMRALMSIARKKALQKNNNKTYFTEPEVGPSKSVSTGNINQENFYEEIHGDSKLRMFVDPLTKASLSPNLVEEEFRQVQNRHQRILGELNLDVEEMLMPSAEAVSEQVEVNTAYSGAGPSMAGAIELNTLHQQPQPQQRKHQDLHRDLLNSQLIEYNRDFMSRASSKQSSCNCNNPSTSNTSCSNINTDSEGGGDDLDSGFSGSNSSYIGSLRYHKSMRSCSSLKSSPVRSPQLCSIEMGPMRTDGAAYLNQDHNSFCCQPVNVPHLDVNDDFGMNSLSLSSRLAPVSYSRCMCCNNGFVNLIGVNSHHQDISGWNNSPSHARQTSSTNQADSKSTKLGFFKLKNWRKFPGFSSSSNISKIKSNGEYFL